LISLSTVSQLFWRACQVILWRAREDVWRRVDVVFVRAGAVGGPGAVLSQVGAVVVLAVVFALAGREEPGVLLASQSGAART
jgi:hypothetical protein